MVPVIFFFTGGGTFFFNYRSVDDIDVYTGSLSEIPAGRSLLGPTVTCMITDQFLRLRRGDRFWYETGQKPQAFTVGKK